MRANEIVDNYLEEGFWSKLGRSVAGGLTGVDLRTQDEIGQQAARSADQLRKQGYSGTGTETPTTRIVVQLADPNQNIPSKYYKTGNSWTNEDGTAVTNPKSIAYLNQLIPTHGRTETISAEPAQPTARRVSRRRKTA
jgi:hypothetical protein